ncbi:hypothetical protein D3C76_1540300 [compost metagenome]
MTKLLNPWRLYHQKRILIPLQLIRGEWNEAQICLFGIRQNEIPDLSGAFVQCAGGLDGLVRGGIRQQNRNGDDLFQQCFHPQEPGEGNERRV